MNIVIIGKGLMLANIVLGAIDAGANIVGVLRYESTNTNPIKLFFEDLLNPTQDYVLLKQLKIPILNFKSVNSDHFRKFLIKKNVDLLIVGTWKEKIKKETFNIPTIGSINVHPSFLPQYRGPNPYLQTILNGEDYSGVTLHLIDESFDTGAILLQEKIKIEKEYTSKDLKEKTVVVARDLIYKFITNIDKNIFIPIQQNDSISSYYSNITGDEKMLDFQTQTSSEIFRTVKALHPYLPTYITHRNNFFIVDPYSIKEINEDFSKYKPGDIVKKSETKNSLLIICKDKKGIQCSNLKLYGANLLTNIYIKYFVKIKD